MENKILKKQELITKEVDFYGDTIMCAEDKSTGKIYVGIKWVCEGIGLTSDQIKNERKKIGKDLVLSKGGQNYPSLQTVEIKRFICILLMVLCQMKNKKKRRKQHNIHKRRYLIP